MAQESLETKLDLLKGASFGQRIAEQEMDELASYFVETDQWKQLVAGEKDIVYGPKGSGKSALYSLLVQKNDELFDRGILVVPAERPAGTPAFRNLAVDPPTAEWAFIGLWKIYFLALAATVLLEWGVETEEARRVYSSLQQVGLLQKKRNLAALLQGARDYIRRISNAEAIEGGISIDSTGVPTAITAKVTLGDTGYAAAPTTVSVDDLLEDADAALHDLDFRVWIVLDRLDVAFSQHEELEKNALRALFKAYLDMQGLRNIATKVFLRTDIWQKITDEGFREASHITRSLTITWERQSLLHLVVRRTLKNREICSYYGVEPKAVFADVAEQEQLIDRMLPDQVDLGRNPRTFDWMLSRTQDGSGQTAPRELIHLLSTLRASQLRRSELGHEPPPDEQLFDRAAFKDALKDVSEVRLKQTLFAEFPALKRFVELLDGQKTQHTLATLGGIWDTDASETREIAGALVDVGFFEVRGAKDNPVYWVPFLYRDALHMVQGEARGFLHYGRQAIDQIAGNILKRVPEAQSPLLASAASGPGYEEISVYFTDARARVPLMLWFVAAEARAPVNLRGRPDSIVVGLRQDAATELDDRAFRIRLNDTGFRWYSQNDGSAGYRFITAAERFPVSLDETVREVSVRVLQGLQRANMVPR